MGAEYFEAVAIGKSDLDAFRNAKQTALWDHGHSGYSGSIAEKPGCKLLNPPQDTPIAATLAYIDLAYHENLEKVPEALRGWAQKASDIANGSKWGDALCIELTPDEAEGYGETCPSDYKVYLFVGYASS